MFIIKYSKGQLINVSLLYQLHYDTQKSGLVSNQRLQIDQRIF